MRVVITEDIIRNALNESIDEFMINEGFGDAVKGAWGYAKKAGNWLKKAAAAYMDKKTNGQWNKKYGIHVQGDNMQVGHYYLKKWFERHYNRLYDIVWGDYYGNRTYFYTEINGRKYNFDHDWKNNLYTLTFRNTGNVYKLKLNNYNVPSLLTITDYNGTEIDRSEKPTQYNNSYYFKCNNDNRNNITIYSGEDSSTPESYIAKNCTPNNFISATQNKLGEGKFKQAAVAYLEYIQKLNSANMQKLRSNPNEQIDNSKTPEWFTMESFYGWWGKNAGNGEKQQNQNQNQPEQQNNNGNNNYAWWNNQKPSSTKWSG